jgi:uncharacterized repeat protein (TIGR02543 family)
MEQQPSEKQPESSFRGLYSKVKISVQTLDKIIIGGIIVGILLVLYGVANNGYNVTFNSRGGTDVPAQTEVMYGDYVVEPEPPTREGYVFTGWYADENCTQRWVMDYSQVGQDTTLYAGWEAE